MQQQELINYIESSILEFGQKFINPKYSCCFFGSEGDIKCYLYSLIAKNKEFLEDLEYTIEEGDKITTLRLHSELPTFEKINTNPGRFDICVINPDDAAKDNLACIEIVWISGVEESKKILKEELDKLSNISNDLENGYIIILNDYKGFTNKDMSNLRKFKENYNKITFFVFDAIKHRTILDSELTKNGKIKY